MHPSRDSFSQTVDLHGTDDFTRRQNRDPRWIWDNCLGSHFADGEREGYGA
jgi:hypothetical protein